MTEPLSSLSSRRFDPQETAIFLDFDGTLVEIADHPDLVTLSPCTSDTLGRLYAGFGGALAVITGRDIDDVDRFLKPLRLPVAGVHGLKRRSRDGSLHAPDFDGQAIEVLNERLEQFVRETDGLLLERKQGSLALHYRARPEIERKCIQAMDDAARNLQGLHLVRGKMVIEAKADKSDKGGAVTDFLSEPPFAGRIPLFAGDDVTDEDAFAVVNDRQGISVKVGPGRTLARYRAGDTSEFLGWLRSLAGTLERTQGLEQS